MKQILTLFIFIIIIWALSCSDGTIPTATEPLVELKATYVTQRPVLDGETNEAVWENARPFYVHVEPADGTGEGFNLIFRAVWWKEWAKIGESWDDRAYLCMTISWPDEQKNIDKYQWQYSADEGKWSRSNNQSDWIILQWYNNSEYNDMWYWDAALTNPLGYAEDEFMLISTIDSVTTASLWIDGLNYLNDTSEEQNTWDLNYDDNLTPRDSTDDRPLWAWKKDVASMELTNPRIESGDASTSLLFKSDSDFLKNTPYLAPESNAVVPGFALEEPVADPADVMAAGKWNNGMWTVEMMRVASTTNSNDVAFSPDDRYYDQPFLVVVGNNSKTPLEAREIPLIISNNEVTLSFEYLAPQTSN